MSTATLDGWIGTVDRYGKAGWITLMVLGFVLFWPIGLALLAYLIWSGRMGCKNHATWGPGKTRDEKRWRWKEPRGSSGNTAFDEYREETLRRLEEEQNEFSSFLDHLRKAKDKAEFDQFMSDRNRQTPSEGNDVPAVSQGR